MRSGWKVLAGTIVLLVLLLASLWRPPVAQAIAAEDEQALIKRGAYLTNVLARCGDCHTPRDAKGRLDMTRHLQGAKMWTRPVRQVGDWEDEAPDITVSGKGKWDADKMITFLSTGKKTEPPMPAYNLSPEDAKAMTAYLRSLPGRKKGEKKEDEKQDKKDKREDKKKEKEDEKKDKKEKREDKKKEKEDN